MKSWMMAAVVIGLIAVLWALVRNETKGGREELVSIRHADLLCSRASAFKQAHGHYPATLGELLAADAEVAGLVKDGWGREIAYQIIAVEAGAIELRSAGADGVINTRDDIISTAKQSHEFRR